MYEDPPESLIDVERMGLDSTYDGFSGVIVELLREGDLCGVGQRRGHWQPSSALRRG